MNLVLFAWGYVALMMAAAEATSPQGSWLGALVTLLLYGVLPMALVAYIMATPARKRARRARELAEGNASPHAAPEPAESLPAEREEP